MTKYKEEVYEYTLTSTKKDIHKFKFTLKKIIDLGYKNVYTTDTDDQELIEKIELNSLYKPNKIEAIEKKILNQHRDTLKRHSLSELEDKGIGRPSTFATIVAKLFERKYALKQIKHNYKDIDLETFSIKPNEELEIKTKKSKSVSEKTRFLLRTRENWYLNLWIITFLILYPMILLQKSNPILIKLLMETKIDLK